MRKLNYEEMCAIMDAIEFLLQDHPCDEHGYLISDDCTDFGATHGGDICLHIEDETCYATMRVSFTENFESRVERGILSWIKNIRFETYCDENMAPRDMIVVKWYKNTSDKIIRATDKFLADNYDMRRRHDFSKFNKPL
jgi:hypothetical protein